MVIRTLLIILGLILALLGADPIPDEQAKTLVWVNGSAITSEQLEHAFTQFKTSQQPNQKNSQHDGSQDNKDLVLNMLIDEELLVQGANKLDLPRNDPNNRKVIIRSVISHITEQAQQAAVSEQQLQQFYQENKTIFQQPKRLQLKVLRFATQQQAEKARQVLLNAGDISTIESIDLNHQLPNAVLPAHVIRRYIGPAMTKKALLLEQNEISEPIAQADGVYLLQAVIVQTAQQLSFDKVREQVTVQLQRHLRDTSLQTHIEALRQKASISYNGKLLNNEGL